MRASSSEDAGERKYCFGGSRKTAADDLRANKRYGENEPSPLPFDLEAKFESRHLDCYEIVWENLKSKGDEPSPPQV
jgi:hypothetical protein